MQEEAAFSLLGIAGELASRRCQVADSRRFNAVSLWQRGGDPRQNVGIRRADAGQFRGVFRIENQRIEQTASAEENGAAAAGTTQDGNAVGATRDFVHIVVQPAAGAEDDREARL